MSAPPQPHDDAVHTHPDNTNRPANQEPPYLFGYDIDALINPPSQPQSRPGSHQHSPDPTNESYFYDAFHPTPSPQPTSFLDSILNPIESQNHQSFGYHVHDSPPRRRQPSPIVSIQSSMPVTGERHGRSARLPNGYVDLTGLSESPDESRRPRRQSPTPGPSAKRRKQNDGMTAKQASLTPEATVEEVDLSEDKQTVHGVLQKQREEAVKAQKPEVTSTTFSTFTCVICMDIPTDLTATACGTYCMNLSFSQS